MSDNIAPTGKIWMYAACGKKARDQYGKEGGWDESCVMNSHLVDEANPVIDWAKVEARRAAMPSFRDMLRAIENLQPDPELLALAQRAIDAVAARK